MHLLYNVHTKLDLPEKWAISQLAFLPTLRESRLKCCPCLLRVHIIYYILHITCVTCTLPARTWKVIININTGLDKTFGVRLKFNFQGSRGTGFVLGANGITQ